MNCDYNHECLEARRFPTGVDSGVFLCRDHYESTVVSMVLIDKVPVEMIHDWHSLILGDPSMNHLQAEDWAIWLRELAAEHQDIMDEEHQILAAILFGEAFQLKLGNYLTDPIEYEETIK